VTLSVPAAGSVWSAEAPPIRLVREEGRLAGAVELDGLGPLPDPSPPASVEERRAVSLDVAGLRSGVVEASRGGFTWVVNSTSAPEAQEHTVRYRRLGYRSSVLRAVVRGRRVFRVALGQFPSVGEAERARPFLPLGIRRDTWLLRLGRTLRPDIRLGAGSAKP